MLLVLFITVLIYPIVWRCTYGLSTITVDSVLLCYVFSLFLFYFFAHFYFPASGQAVVTGVVHPPPRFLPSIFIAQRVQQSHCSSIFHRVLLTHALALSASQFVHKKESQRIYTNMHSAGLEPTKLTFFIPGSRITRYATRATRYFIVVKQLVYY